jgi:hypothetical protein
MHVNLHDVRLEGIPPQADFNLSVGERDGLAATMTRIRQYALNQTGPVTMDIMCHGFERDDDPVGRQTLEHGFGGGGLELTRDWLDGSNVSATAELNGVVSTIVVYSCGAARTRAGYEGTSWDGQRLFREMAAHTGATIYAADATQWYWNTRVDMPNACSSVIDFGRFEGNVYRFTPDGTSTLVESNQLEAH